jgi:homoserine kinase type II
MAVYTRINEIELKNFLNNYQLDELSSYTGITEGVENTNYLIVCGNTKYILTLYEKRVAEADLPFFINLLNHLSEKDIASPIPIRMRNAQYIGKINEKSAALFSFIEGSSTKKITEKHCKEVGKALASMHIASKDIDHIRQNSLSFNSWENLYNSTKGNLDKIKFGLSGEISEELENLRKNWPNNLPKGIIHGDLFPDNIFFINKDLSGLIDFYFACEEFYAFDIAICINAWCFESDCSFNITKAKRLLGAYQEKRILTKKELKSLPVLCRGAALRFLLTRSIDWFIKPENVLVIPKDPIEYYNKLKFHQSINSVNDYGLYEYN